MVGTVPVGTELGGTLGVTVPARAELMGNFDVARLVGTVLVIAPGGFVLAAPLEGTELVAEELMGNLEGTVLANAGLAGPLEDTVVVVIELVDIPGPLEQTAALAWSPAPPTEAGPVGGEEMPGPADDTEGPGKRLARGWARDRGWKETVGDTGPRGGTRLEGTSAVWVLLGSVS